MIKADKDSMVPERWGRGALASTHDAARHEGYDWYKKDLFGLKTADEAGKILFNSTDGTTFSH